MSAVRIDPVTIDRVSRRWVSSTQREPAELIPMLRFREDARDEALDLTTHIATTGQGSGWNLRQIGEPLVRPEQITIDNAEHERGPLQYGTTLHRDMN